MSIEDLKALLYQTDESAEQFEEFVRHGGCEQTINGVELKCILHERDNESMVVVFRANDKFYSTTGSYDSWNGTEWYDIRGFWEVEAKQVTRTEYVPVK